MFLKFFNSFRHLRSKFRQNIFLDYAGGTPVSYLVLKEMNEVSKYFANPSGLYKESLKAKDLISLYKTRIARVLNVQKNEIIFTSGGTEGNNFSLLGIFEAYKTKDFTPHFITTNIEHSSILEVCKEIQRRGGEVTILSVKEDGQISLPEFKNSLKQNTVLISFSLANSEIGTIQPIAEISKIIKDLKKENKKTPYLHLDAGASPLYLNMDIDRHGVDLLTLDGAKIYGPKGVGVVFVRSGINIKPLIFGGGQERGLRSGTENLPSIAGFAVAIEEAHKNRESESERLSSLRDYGINLILKEFKDSKLNGSLKHRLPNNINICFPDLDAEFATIQLDLLGFSVSYSSSCMTLKDDLSSYVIRALGREECSKSSLRFTLGKDTKKSDIERLVSALKKVVIK